MLMVVPRVAPDHSLLRSRARAKNRTGRASSEIFFSTARGDRAEFENNAAAAAAPPLPLSFAHARAS